MTPPDSSCKRRPWQFSLRTLLIAVTAFALLLGIIASWPTHIASFEVPRWEYDSKAHVLQETGTAFRLQFSRRWGKTFISVTPYEGLGEADRAELIWLEDGKLFRVDLGNREHLASGQVTTMASWPLVFGVIQHYLNQVALLGQTVSDIGLIAPICGKTIDRKSDPHVEENIDRISRAFLDNIQQYMRKRH
jgi:hypothetical protein